VLVDDPLRSEGLERAGGRVLRRDIPEPERAPGRGGAQEVSGRGLIVCGDPPDGDAAGVLGVDDDGPLLERARSQ
jgi:hypothetical protein